MTEVSEENPGRFGTRLGLRGEEGFTSERCRGPPGPAASFVPMKMFGPDVGHSPGPAAFSMLMRTFGPDVSRLLAFCVLLRMPSLKTLSLFRS